jgi:hypothetical protein
MDIFIVFVQGARISGSKLANFTAMWFFPEI